LIKENRDKIPAAELSEAEEAVKRAKEVLDSQDRNKLQKALDELNRVSSKIAQVLYSQAKTAGGSQQQQTQTDKQQKSQQEGEVIDAEYEEGEGN